MMQSPSGKGRQGPLAVTALVTAPTRGEQGSMEAIEKVERKKRAGGPVKNLFCWRARQRIRRPKGN